MKILVCVKQVPDTNEVRINKETGTLIRDGVPSILNPDDANALEEALKIKDEHDDVTITVITMGPPQADMALKEALAMGADRGILLTDRAFAGADTWATSSALAGALKNIDFEYLVLGHGKQVISKEDSYKLIEKHLNALKKYLYQIRELLVEPKSLEILLKNIINNNNLSNNYKEYHFFKSSLVSVISYLVDLEEIGYILENGELLYYTKTK